MMLDEDPRGYSRIDRMPRHDPSLLSSTSAPLTTSPDATTTTTMTTNNNTTSTGAQMHNFQQMREAQLRHALEHSTPSSADVSAVASAAYVRALMELIDQHGTDVERVQDQLEAMRAQREGFQAELAHDALQLESAVQQLRNERSDLTLRVQEEQERSTRLLHEVTVLHTQRAEQQEQLGKLVDLCRARGKRLRYFYHHVKTSGTSGGGKAGGSRLSGALGRENDDAALVQESPSAFSVAEVNTTPTRTTSAPRAILSPTSALSSSPAGLPASLSIHRAAHNPVAAATAAAVAGKGDGKAFSLADVGDDPELAAILHVPYKVQFPYPSSPNGDKDSVAFTPPPPLSSSSPSNSPTIMGGTAAAMRGHVGGRDITVTANTAHTAQLMALQEQVHMLQQQLEEQRITYEEERGARTREDDERHRGAVEKVAKYATTVQQLEALHEESLRELVQYRHHTEIQLRDVRGQVEWLRAALQKALELAEKDRRRQHNEVYATEQRMSKQYFPKVQSLHAELAEYRRTTAAQARDHAAALARKDEEIAALQQKWKAEVQQRRRVEERYKLEMDGVHSELDLMRQSLRQMERRVYYRSARDQTAESTELELEQYYH